MLAPSGPARLRILQIVNIMPDTPAKKVASPAPGSPAPGSPKVNNKYAHVKSKIGSLENMNHTPGGGDKKIESRKLDFNKNASPKIDAKIPDHKPGGGNVKIFDQKPQLTNVSSKVGSLDNINHKAGGGNVQIHSEKLDFKEKAAPRIDAKLPSTVSGSSSGEGSTKSD